LSTAVNDGLTVREIRRGAADRYIRSYARDVREYGKPVLITLFNGEFNGSWWWAVIRVRDLDGNGRVEL